MPPDFSQRSRQAEIMDSGMDSFADFDRALRQIEAVNSATLGYRAVLRWLERQDMATTAGRPVTIIDAGCGRGALLRRIRAWGRKRRLDMRLIGIDNNPWARTSAEKASRDGAPIEYRTADILEIESTPSPDFVVCSHVMHHFGDGEIVRFLQWLDRHAARGWFISDLHRHPAPYFLAKSLLSVAPVGAMVRNDGPVSVLRAFTRGDWEKLLDAAEIPPRQRRIDWSFPFRYGISGRSKI